jgi:hypothetical protein
VDANRRYPGRNQPGSRRNQMPQRSGAQQVRLWILSLCCALPAAILVYFTQSFWPGAALFVMLAIVLGFGLHLLEKHLARKQDRR